MLEIFAANVPAGASLGYTLYKDGVQVGTRTTASIIAVGASTGVYRAVVDESAADLVIWDTGGDFPKFSSERISAPLSSVTPTIGGSSVSPTIGGGTVTVVTPILGAR